MQKIESEGDYKRVFKDIKNFKLRRMAGEELERGPLLLVLSGTQRGVYSGGGVTALERLGLTDAFKTVVGVSTGAPVVSYFLAGQAELGTSIYYEENIGKEFINLRPNNYKENIVDVTWLCNEVFRKGNKKLNVEKILQNQTDIYFAVTDKNSGQGYLVDGKKIEDLVAGINASAAIPEMYKDKVFLKINGKKKRVVDGFVAFPFPVKQTVEKFNPTSILIFANRPKKIKINFLNKIGIAYIKFLLGDKLGGLTEMQNIEFDRQYKYLKKLKIPYTIVWTSEEIANLETDPKKLIKAAVEYRDFVLKLAAGSL